MPAELLFRFMAGGLVVSAFAVLGCLLQPKTLGGLFGAAPSVGLATLALTFFTHGERYAAVEGRSMIFGSLALLGYALFVRWLIDKRHLDVLVAASTSGLAWLALAFSMWGIVLR